MTTYVFDIETNGLDPTEIWCLSCINVNDKVQHNFGPDNLDKGLGLLQKADKLIGHNILGFDIPVIKKLKGLDLFGKKILDTLVVSRLFNPVREGNHGLERWGYHLNFHKIDFEEYDNFSKEMLEYCARDTLLNLKVYNALKLESAGFSRESIDLEHEVYKILNQQRTHGFLLDQNKAAELLEELNIKKNDIEEQVQRSVNEDVKIFKLYPKTLKTGELSKLGLLVDENGNTRQTRLTPEQLSKFLDGSKHLIISETPEFNLNSRKQIGEKLIQLGWNPQKFTPTGQPIVDEGTLSKIKGIPQATLIAEYLMLQKRIAQIISWFKELNENTGRIHGFVNHNGTITGRMTHRNPNMAQVPSTASPYGKECRACWTVPAGYKLVGIDASGLELRMLAHYMRDEEYTNEIINGDIHTTNQKLAGLKSRNQAKTFIYALLYGAGDAKLATVVKGNKQDGARLRKSFLDNLPSFANLRGKVSRASKKGYLKGIDGRKLFVRSEHSALNTLLQGAGAIVMKKALVIFNEKLSNIDAHFVANVHDEWQLEVREDLADHVGKLGVQSIIEAGEFFKLSCPLDGEYRIGNDWSETH